MLAPWSLRVHSFSLSHNNRRLVAPTLLFGSAGDRMKEFFQQLNDSNSTVTGRRLLISEEEINEVAAILI